MKNKIFSGLLLLVFALLVTVIMDSENELDEPEVFVQDKSEIEYEDIEQNIDKEKNKPKGPLKVINRKDHEDKAVAVLEVISKTQKVEGNTDSAVTEEESELVKTKSFLITITDIKNSPLEGIVVNLKQHKEQQKQFSEFKTINGDSELKSDANGNVKIAITDSKYLFINIKQKKYSHYEKLNIDLENEKQLLIRLEKAALISGRITNAKNGKGIPNAKITASRRQRGRVIEKVSVSSDKNGNYEISVPSEKNYNLKVWAKTYIIREPIDVKLSKGKSLVKNFELDLGRESIIKLIEAESGEVIPNLKITLNAWKNNRFWESQRYIEKSNAEGLVLLNGLSDSGDEFSITSEHYEVAIFSPSKGDEVREVKLQKGGSIYVEVKDKSGKVLKGVQFNQGRSNWGNSQDRTQRMLFYGAQFDEESQKYIVEGLKAKEFSINVVKEGYKGEELKFKLEKAQKKELSVVLKDAQQLKMLILDEDGNEINDEVKISFIQFYGNLDNLTKATQIIIDDKIHYTVSRPLRERSFQVLVGSYAYSQKISIKSEDDHVYKVILKKGYKLEGFIYDDDGNPIVESEVLVKQQHYTIGKVSSDKLGFYQIDSLKKGKYGITVKHPDFQTNVSSIEIIDEVHSHDFKLNKGRSLKGLILLPDGKPAKNCKVSYTKAGMTSRHRGESVSTNENGEFTLKHLGAIKLTFRISFKDYVKIERVVDLAKEWPEKLTFNLSRGYTLKGQLLFNEQPLPNIKLGIYSSKRSRYAMPKTFVSGSNGGFEVTSLNAETYYFYLEHQKYSLNKSYSVKISLDVNDYVIQVEELKLTKGKVFHPDGSRADSYDIYVKQVDTSISRRIGNVIKSEEGFSFKEKGLYLRKGVNYQIQAKAKDYSPVESEPFNTESVPSELNLYLKPEKKFSFKISDVSARGIENVEVFYIRSVENGSLGSFFSSNKVLSDSNGLAVIKNITDGWYKIKFVHKDYAQTIELFNLISENQNETQFIKLNLGSKLTAVILSQENEMMKNGRIWLTPIGQAKHSHFVKAESSGEFKINGISVGEYKLLYFPEKTGEYMSEWGVDDQKNIVIDGNGESTVTLGGSDLDKLGGIDGVIPNGERIYSVVLKSIEPKKNISNVGYVKNAKFYFNYLKPGKYIVEARSYSKKRLKSKEFFVKENERTEVKLESSTE